MTDESEAPAPRKYGKAARLFHWTTVVMVGIMIPVGITMTSGFFEGTGFQDPLFILHKGLGVVILALVVLRLGWRLFQKPPPFPDTMPPVEQWMAKTTHWGLYVLLLVQTVSGYLRTVAGNFPIEILEVVGIPPLLSEMPELERAMLLVHTASAYILTAAIAAHVSAAVYHAITENDGILRRIWPPV
ncbi:MAG: cytochrome b [Longimicrobiales bacterium]